RPRDLTELPAFEPLDPTETANPDGAGLPGKERGRAGQIEVDVDSIRTELARVEELGLDLDLDAGDEHALQRREHPAGEVHVLRETVLDHRVGWEMRRVADIRPERRGAGVEAP